MLEAIEAKRVDGSGNLENGLGGIGWGIQYLITHRFIEGDADEVLEDFDERMQHAIDGLERISVDDWSKHVAENEFLLGLDAYLYARRAKRDFYTADNLRKIAGFYLQMLGSGCVFPLRFLNACYSFLLLIGASLDEESAQLLRERLERSYRKAIGQKKYAASDRAFLLRMEEHAAQLPWYSRFFASVEEESNGEMEIDAWLPYAKMELLTYDESYPLFKPGKVDAYLNKGMEDMPSCDLSLGSGVSGVGLCMIKALGNETAL